jgi:hypothetical protein
VQTVEKFFPHLIQDDRTREAALDAIAVLGEQQLAMTLAEILAAEAVQLSSPSLPTRQIPHWPPKQLGRLRHSLII